MVWAVSSSLVSFLLLLVLTPCARDATQACLRSLDGFASAHSPPQYAALRKISTPVGGWCTVLGILTAVAASSNLVVQYAYNNSVATDGLRVATQGVEGAEQTAAARTAMVMDVVVPALQVVGCNQSMELTVLQAGVSIASDGGGPAPPHSLGRLTASAETHTLLRPGHTRSIPLCWMRAVCLDCGLP